MGDQDQFLWAIKNGDMDQVKAILKSDPEAVTRPFSSGSIPMTTAADYGQNEVITYLIENGASIDDADGHGITPLLAAVYEGHTKTVKYLIGKGAKKTGKAPDGSQYKDCAEKQEIKDLL